ncbi:MAG: transcriptional regulator, partial [Acinetobacter sp.]|nr:transcriptional regulator [Acinetobacter sp.]
MAQMRNLVEKRKQIEQFRQSSSLSPTHAELLGQSILSSWNRSKTAEIPKDRSAAPMQTMAKQTPNALEHALRLCAEDLKHIAQQSSMVVAVGDVGSTIIWTASSQQMQSAAESVHFMQGGQWKEELVGTNALALSLKTQQSSCVFSNEHYMSSIHDWVCYAAPIVDPYSKQILGVIDLSTTWKNHNSLGLLAAERCASIIQSALQEQYKQQLYIRAFSASQVLFNGRVLVLTPRQIEILIILALCPQGMTLDTLHQA